jgi:hypothetical protein
MCPVPLQGVVKGLNTSFAAAILRDPSETDRIITKRKKGRFRRVLEKVDPTHFKTLDRRPTVLLQATRKQTEPKKNLSPSFLPEGSDGSRQQQQQSPVTTGSGSPQRSGLGLDEPRSTPAGVGVAGGAYRDPFESAPASAAFPANPSTTSLDDDVEPQSPVFYSPIRRTYPSANGDGTDDEDSVPPLWREDDEETDATSSPEPLHRTLAPPKGF